MKEFTISGFHILEHEKKTGTTIFEIDHFISENEELMEKDGCYVFCIRSGGGITPWYVGKTKRSFKEEIFQDHKKLKYMNALGKVERGSSGFFFVIHPSGKTNASQIDEIETFLIKSCIIKNPNLENDRKTGLDDWYIKGVTQNTGKPSDSENSFKKMIGFD